MQRIHPGFEFLAINRIINSQAECSDVLVMAIHILMIAIVAVAVAVVMIAISFRPKPFLHVWRFCLWIEKTRFEQR